MELNQATKEKINKFFNLEYTIEELEEFKLEDEESLELYDKYFVSDTLIKVMDKCLEKENPDEYFNKWCFNYLVYFISLFFVEDKYSKKAILRGIIDYYFNLVLSDPLACRLTKDYELIKNNITILSFFKINLDNTRCLYTKIYPDPRTITDYKNRDRYSNDNEIVVFIDDNKKIIFVNNVECTCIGDYILEMSDDIVLKQDKVEHVVTICKLLDEGYSFWSTISEEYLEVIKAFLELLGNGITEY